MWAAYASCAHLVMGYKQEFSFLFVSSQSQSRKSLAPIAGFLSAKSNSGHRGLVSSVPTVSVTARPFSVRLHIAPAAFSRDSRQLYPELLHECGESCNSLSRSVGSPGRRIPHGGCRSSNGSWG